MSVPPIPQTLRERFARSEACWKWLYYEVKVEHEGGEWIGYISADIVKRLWRRHWEGRCVKPLSASTSEVAAFEDELTRNLRKKCILCRDEKSGVVASEWYKCWRDTSRVSVELFADCINESGLLAHYCSLFPEDRAFGSLGCWEEAEDAVAGGVACAPFDIDLRKVMMEKFNAGVAKPKARCRIVLLPLGPAFKAREEMRSVSFRGELLVELCGLRRYRASNFFRASSPLEPEYFDWMDLGVFIWANREYYLQSPPPQDIEAVCMRCIQMTCRSPSLSKFHRSSFLRSFPRELRCNKGG